MYWQLLLFLGILAKTLAELEARIRPHPPLEDGIVPVPVPRFNARLKETSVSGFSSGAFFASQFHIAHSEILVGAGLVNGGQYGCVKHNPLILNCLRPSQRMFPLEIFPSLKQVYKENEEKIDDIRNLPRQRVLLISSMNDTIVRPKVADKLEEFYQMFISEKNLKRVKLIGSHNFPTDFNATGNGDCFHENRPFLANCEYDGAGAILKHIYGEDLNPRNEDTLTGTLMKFEQTELYQKPSKIGLDEFGYIFAPKDCIEGEQCRVHVVFHGCKQTTDIGPHGMHFILNSGYMQWADTNRIILVFPQTVQQLFSFNFEKGIPIHIGKVLACWDMFGMYDNEYTNKNGVQVQAIWKLLNMLVNA